MQHSFWDFAEKIAIPLLVAGITYFIARKQLVNSGLTQFRQRWIDDLRDSISTFITEAEIISMLDMEDDEQYFEHFRELSRMSIRIALMLNPNEEEHNKVKSYVEKIRNIIHDDKISEKKLGQALNRNIEELLIASKLVLKKEWNRVKSNS